VKLSLYSLLSFSKHHCRPWLSGVGVSLVIGVGMVLATSRPVLAVACEDIQCDRDSENYFSCNNKKQQCLRDKIAETQTQARSLQNAIDILQDQIAVQQLKIAQTRAEIRDLEKQIEELTERIYGLDLSLDRLSGVLVDRVIKHYKIATSNPVLTFFSNRSLNSSLAELKYQRLVQRQTAQTLAKAENQRLTYDEQRQLKQQKQLELDDLKSRLEQQTALLDAQQADKEELLRVTKNDEQTYQQLLAEAIADRASIERALSSVGAKVGDVGRGEVIASVGNTGCSSGPHLHFEAYKNAKVKDGKVVDKESDDPVQFKITDHLINPLDKINSGSFKHPLPGSTITNGFKTPYFLGIHTGVDFAYLHSDRVTRGQPILAADKGVAYLAQDPQLCSGFESNGVGKGMIVDHENGFVTLYWHIP